MKEDAKSKIEKRGGDIMDKEISENKGLLDCLKDCFSVSDIKI
jgi:hypothetical protein